MRAILLLAALATAARADALYDVRPSMGSIVEANHTPCGADAQAWLLRFVGDLQVLTIGVRHHIRLVYASATRPPGFELDGDLLLGFWYQGDKTVYVTVQGDDVHPRVDVAFILRDADGTCYEKWQGIGLRR